MHKDVHLCFIDFAKAFDNVKRVKLMEILRRMHIDGKDLRIITSLYWNQSASIKVGNLHGGRINIKRDVSSRRYCSIYSLNKSSEKHWAKLRKQSITFDMPKTLLLSLMTATRLMQSTHTSSQEYGLELNTTKTKCMLISRTQQPPMQLTFNSRNIEQVDTHTHTLEQESTQNGETSQQK